MIDRPTLYAIDADWALRELDDDVVAYVKICRRFLTQADRTLDQLRYPSESPLDTVRGVVHELTTSAYIVGARQASAYFRELQMRLHAEAAVPRGPDPATHVPELVEVVRGLRSAVAAQLSPKLA